MPQQIETPALDQVFRSIGSEQVFYLPTPGNGGDALITSGTVDYFASRGVNFQPITAEAEFRGGIVVLGGGGNFVPLYGFTRRKIQQFSKSAKKVVMLPHSIRGNEDVLSELGRNVVLFTRDKNSYEHAKQHCARCEVLIDHDMAFHLDVARIDRIDHEIASAAQRRQCWRKKFDVSSLKGLKKAYFMRNDKEAIEPPSINHGDISAIFSMGSNVDLSPISTWCMFQAIRAPEELVTDRLHVGIGAALLGKSCELRNNNYGKIEDIYEYSMAGRYPHVQYERRDRSATIGRLP